MGEGAHGWAQSCEVGGGKAGEQRAASFPRHWHDLATGWQYTRAVISKQWPLYVTNHLVTHGYILRP